LLAPPTDYYDLLYSQRPATRYAPSCDLLERLADAIGVPLEPALGSMDGKRTELQDMLLSVVPYEYEPLQDLGRPPWDHIKLRNLGYVIKVWTGSSSPRKLARIVGYNQFLGPVHRIGRVLESEEMYMRGLLDKTLADLERHEALAPTIRAAMPHATAAERLQKLFATDNAITA
jgi:hypothetical protein